MQCVHECVAVTQIFWRRHHDPRRILCGLEERPAFTIERRPVAGDHGAQNGLGVGQLLAHHGMQLHRLIGHSGHCQQHDSDCADDRAKLLFHRVPSLAFAAPQSGE
jgi:hypothetical protein